MKSKKIDLETVNPLGRFDVLLYKGIGEIVKSKEKEMGLSGVWDMLKPHANVIVAGALSGVQVPTPIKICLGIIQAQLIAQGAENDEDIKIRNLQRS